MKKRNLLRKILLWVLGFVLCIALVCAVFVKSKLDKIQYSGSRQTQSENVTEGGLENGALDISTPDMDIIAEKGVLNILLLGTDERSYELSENARADCMMLLSLNMNDHSGKLISLERGMGVVMLDGPYKGGVDLLTHCFRWGGAELVLQEVQEYFKVDVDKYVRVNFSALAKFVNVIGGVDVELTETEAWYLNAVAAGESTGGYGRMKYYIYDGETPQTDLVPGVNHLYGSAALSYARLRKIDSDWHRIERQRNLVQACITEAKELDIKTLNKLCDEILPMVQTNFTQTEILRLLLEVPNFAGVQFDQLTVPVDRDTMGGIETFTGGGAFLPDYELNARAIQEFIYEDAK